MFSGEVEVGAGSQVRVKLPKSTLIMQTSKDISRGQMASYMTFALMDRFLRMALPTSNSTWLVLGRVRTMAGGTSDFLGRAPPNCPDHTKTTFCVRHVGHQMVKIERPEAIQKPSLHPIRVKYVLSAPASKPRLKSDAFCSPINKRVCTSKSVHQSTKLSANRRQPKFATISHARGRSVSII